MRSAYVAALAVLIAASEEDDERRTPLDEVHPVAWSVVDAHLGYSATDGPSVAWVARESRRIRTSMRALASLSRSRLNQRA